MYQTVLTQNDSLSYKARNLTSECLTFLHTPIILQALVNSTFIQIYFDYVFFFHNLINGIRTSAYFYSSGDIVPNETHKSVQSPVIYITLDKF